MKIIEKEKRKWVQSRLTRDDDLLSLPRELLGWSRKSVKSQIWRCSVWLRASCWKRKQFCWLSCVRIARRKNNLMAKITLGEPIELIGANGKPSFLLIPEKCRWDRKWHLDSIRNPIRCFSTISLLVLGQYLVNSGLSCGEMYYHLVSHQRPALFHHLHLENRAHRCSMSGLFRQCHLSPAELLLTCLWKCFDSHLHVHLANSHSISEKQIRSVEKALFHLQHHLFPFDYPIDLIVGHQLVDSMQLVSTTHCPRQNRLHRCATCFETRKTIQRENYSTRSLLVLCYFHHFTEIHSHHGQCLCNQH